MSASVDSNHGYKVSDPHATTNDKQSDRTNRESPQYRTDRDHDKQSSSRKLLTPKSPSLSPHTTPSSCCCERTLVHQCLMHHTKSPAWSKPKRSSTALPGSELASTRSATSEPSSTVFSGQRRRSSSAARHAPPHTSKLSCSVSSAPPALPTLMPMYTPLPPLVLLSLPLLLVPPATSCCGDGGGWGCSGCCAGDAAPDATPPRSASPSYWCLSWCRSIAQLHSSAASAASTDVSALWACRPRANSSVVHMVLTRWKPCSAATSDSARICSLRTLCVATAPSCRPFFLLLLRTASAAAAAASKDTHTMATFDANHVFSSSVFCADRYSTLLFLRVLACCCGCSALLSLTSLLLLLLLSRTMRVRLRPPAL
eukprot:PhM_4_TR10086/c1_g1_i5/m.75581